MGSSASARNRGPGHRRRIGFRPPALNLVAAPLYTGRYAHPYICRHMDLSTRRDLHLPVDGSTMPAGTPKHTLGLSAACSPDIQMRQMTFAFLLACTLFVTQAISADTSSISVRGKTFRIGDTADAIFQTLKPADSKRKDVGSDPANPRSLSVTHHYDVEGKSFSLTFGRTIDPGPYRLIRISTSLPQKTTPTVSLINIAEFESSAFFKKQTMVSKDAWNLRTGGRNHSYSFRDSENPDSSFGVELITNGQGIIEIGIHWNGKSTSAPARITAKKEEHLADLAAFWGIGNQARQVIEYAKGQQSKRYKGGSSQAPRTTLGKISIHCGTTGETLWLGWKKLRNSEACGRFAP